MAKVSIKYEKLPPFRGINRMNKVVSQGQNRFSYCKKQLFSFSFQK